MALFLQDRGSRRCQLEAKAAPPPACLCRGISRTTRLTNDIHDNLHHSVVRWCLKRWTRTVSGKRDPGYSSNAPVFFMERTEKYLDTTLLRTCPKQQLPTHQEASKGEPTSMAFTSSIRRPAWSLTAIENCRYRSRVENSSLRPASLHRLAREDTPSFSPNSSRGNGRRRSWSNVLPSGTLVVSSPRTARCFHRHPRSVQTKSSQDISSPSITITPGQPTFIVV